jgi:prophage regulatory protein
VTSAFSDRAVIAAQSTVNHPGPGSAESDRLLRYADLKNHNVPFSRPHVDRLEREGRFPRRVRLGPGTVGWWRSEICQWLDEKTAQRGS